MRYVVGDRREGRGRWWEWDWREEDDRGRGAVGVRAEEQPAEAWRIASR